MESTSPRLPVEKPLTDPADLMQLLGRMLASTVLFCLTIFWILRTVLDHNVKNVTMLTTTGIISLMLQRATVKLWRRLRDERMEAEAARAAEKAAAASVPEESHA